MILRTQITKRLTYLQPFILRLKKMKSPVSSVSIRVAKHGNIFQYYLRKNSKDKTGQYIKSKDIIKYIPLIQNEYNQKALLALSKEEKLLRKLDDFYKKNSIVENIFSQFPLGKQAVITPLMESEDQFLNRWLSKEFVPLDFKENEPEYYSKKGERMRSKSELLISGILIDLGINYIYEMPLQFKNGRIIHPDFTIIDAKNRRIIYYEHFGMMDKEDYARKNIGKIIDYQANGYYLGNSLIASFETSINHIDVKAIQKMLEYYVLGK